MAVASTNIVQILLTVKDQGSAQLRQFADSLASAEKQAVQTTAAVGIASAAALVGLTHATVQGAKFSDAIDDLSARTLASRETVTALGVSLARTGEDFLASEVAVRTFNRALVDAASGQETALRPFRALGFSIEDLVGPGGKLRTIDELLPTIAERFRNLSDDATRVDVAMTMFGRSGTALVPALNGGAAGIEALRTRARELIPVSGQAARELGAVDDASEDLSIAMKGLQSSIGVGLAPAVGDIISQLTEGATSLSAYAAAHPQVSAAVGGTAAALAGGAGLIAALTAGNKLLEKMQVAGVGAGAALRGLVIASAAAAAITGLALAAGYTVDTLSELKAAEDDHSEALEEYRDLLADTSRSMEELRRVEGELAESASRHAGARTKLNALLSGTISAITHQPLVVDVVPEMKMDPDDVEDQLPGLWTRAGAAARAAAERQKPVEVTIPVQAIGLEADLSRAREELSGLVEEERQAEAALRSLTATPSAAADAVEAASQKQKAAHEKTAAAALRVAEAEKRLADENRNAAKSAEQLAAGLLSADVAANKVSLEDALSRQREALVRSSAALDAARAAAASATPGTEAYREAQQRLAEAMGDYNNAAGAVLSTEEELARRRQKSKQDIDANAAAWEALSDAQARAKVAGASDKDRERSEQALDTAIATRELGQAQAAYNEVLAAGPPTLEQQTAGIELLAAAQDQLNASMKTTTTDAQIAASAVGAIGGAIASLGGDAAHTMQSVIQLIQQILRLQSLQGTEKTLGGIGIIGSLVGIFAGMQGGGTMMSGSVGVDSNLVALGRQETVLDHSLTSELRDMARAYNAGDAAAAVSSGRRELHVSFPSTFHTGSRSDAWKSARLLRRELDQYDELSTTSPRFA